MPGIAVPGLSDCVRRLSSPLEETQPKMLPVPAGRPHTRSIGPAAGEHVGEGKECHHLMHRRHFVTLLLFRTRFASIKFFSKLDDLGLRFCRGCSGIPFSR
jgi:hypothetical protein